MFRCFDCGKEFGSIQAISAHVRLTHKRQKYIDERKPVEDLVATRQTLDAGRHERVESPRHVRVGGVPRGIDGDGPRERAGGAHQDVRPPGPRSPY